MVYSSGIHSPGTFGWRTPLRPWNHLQRDHFGQRLSCSLPHKGGTDDAAPWAGLLLFNSTLFGTTSRGGTSPNRSRGCGTVFALTPRCSWSLRLQRRLLHHGFWPLATFSPLFSPRMIALSHNLSYERRRQSSRCSFGPRFAHQPLIRRTRSNR